MRGWVAALELASELGAPSSVLRLLNEKLDAARSALEAVKVSEFGAKHKILDFVAARRERAHPQPPR